jgi:insertion element IS1 protein InsB
MAFVFGDCSTETGRKLWDKIKEIQIDRVASDYWSAYEDFVPPEKHLQTKRETYTVEGYNARIRQYLARFHRRTKCYSKSEEMINLSLKLLCRKLNKYLYKIKQYQTPNEVYFNRHAANAKTRIETRPKTKHSTPCAKPRMCIAGKAGTKVKVRNEFLEGKLHLPIIRVERI